MNAILTRPAPSKAPQRVSPDKVSKTCTVSAGRQSEEERVFEARLQWFLSVSRNA